MRNSDRKNDHVEKKAIHQTPSQTSALIVALRRSIVYFSKFIYIKNYVNVYSKPIHQPIDRQVIGSSMEETVGSAVALKC